MKALASLGENELRKVSDLFYRSALRNCGNDDEKPNHRTPNRMYPEAPSRCLFVNYEWVSGNY